ncbi:sugar 3,4-ketoisomerase [Mucilaginibacter psychrotolerans]|uniref:WxcM-like domain-containing protein n=1 Tax=Mucilaginibacter psychrotolerans TaxID=1524096 RepID=A0A4Y8S964_9SPHI|nr:FdtA/QdtA family cupin domain-containing protein [Mucilaginibacter psychrotolerans]TFF35528.1 WxcM-like domain-containing protein [Mucilaginibacter psychrotolerans]
MKPSIYNCNVIELPKIHNRAGNITPVNNYTDIPFHVKRVYYLYDVPGGETRGGHGHKQLHQVIIAASGSFDVMLDDGHIKKLVTLNRPNYALLIVPGIWRDLLNFSSGAVLLVLASETYDENDYLRDYNEFLEFKSGL